MRKWQQNCGERLQNLINLIWKPPVKPSIVGVGVWFVYIVFCMWTFLKVGNSSSFFSFNGMPCHECIYQLFAKQFFADIAPVQAPRFNPNLDELWLLVLPVLMSHFLPVVKSSPPWVVQGNFGHKMGECWHQMRVYQVGDERQNIW